MFISKLTFPLLWDDAVPPLEDRFGDDASRPDGNPDLLSLLCEPPLRLCGLSVMREEKYEIKISGVYDAGEGEEAEDQRD